MSLNTVSGRLGAFVAGLTVDNLPREVVEKAKACLLNAYGIGIGSNHLPYGPVARKTAFEADGVIPHGATVFGDGRKTSVSGATLANAVLFNGRNQEDFVNGSTHTGVMVVPVLTALIEAKGFPTDRLIPAMVAAYEVAGALDEAYSNKTTPNFFRGTALFGIVGAAAAVARLYGLSAERTAAALSNAACFAGGILQSQAGGSDEWRYQVGVFQSLGMTAAQLAHANSVSAPLAFEGKAGFVKAFARTECDADALTANLGRDWGILKVSFKPYPLPAWNQTAVMTGLKVRERIGNRKVKAIEVRMSPYEVNYPGKNSPGPFDNETSAKLSIPFTVATTLAHGTPTFAVLLDYRNAQTADMLERMKLIPDLDMPRLSCRLAVTLDNGEVIDEALYKKTSDFSFDCEQISQMARTVGKETGVPERAYDLLDTFVDQLPGHSDIGLVIDAFDMMPRM